MHGKKLLASLSLAALTTLAGSSYVKADSPVVLSPTDDTYIFNRNSSTQGFQYNNGTTVNADPNEHDGGVLITGPNDRIGIRQYNLASAIPAGMTITGATLSGPVIDGNGQAGTITAYIDPLAANSLSPISESTLTYNSYVAGNYAAAETDGGISFIVPDGGVVGTTPISTSANVAGLAALNSAVASGSDVLFTLRTADPAVNVQFDDKEDSASGTEDQEFAGTVPITLTLTYAVPEPTSLGLVSMGLFGLAGRSMKRRRSE